MGRIALPGAVALLLLAGPGCDRKPTPKTDPPSPSPRARPVVAGPAARRTPPRRVARRRAPPPGPQRLTIHLKPYGAKRRYPVRLTLPGSWERSKQYGGFTYVPRKQPSQWSYTTLSVQVGGYSCAGPCDPRQARKNLESGVRDFRRQWKIPKAGRSPQATLLQDQTLPGDPYRRILAVRTHCPKPKTGEPPPCAPRLMVRCWYHAKGANYHLVAAGGGPVSVLGSPVWAQLLRLCRTLELLPPTP